MQQATGLLRHKKLTDVLDIGIGTGAFADIFHKRGCRIRGIDPSREMLKECQKEHSSFELSVGSFTIHDFSEHEFDTVISSFAFHEVNPQDREEACQSLYKIIRPGGFFCMVDILLLPG